MPSWLGDLPNLRQLEMDGNAISGPVPTIAGQRAEDGLNQLQWVGDGLSSDEQAEFDQLIELARKHPWAMSTALKKSWFDDGVSESEVATVQDLGNLPLDMAQVNAGMPYLDEITVPDAFAVRSLAGIGRANAADLRDVMSRPWLADGVSDREAQIVLLLDETYRYNRSLMDTLLDLDQVTVEERAIDLPLAGRVDLVIIRTSPGAERSMDLLEHSLRSAEGFMGEPLKTNFVALLFEEGANVRSGVNTGTHLRMHARYDVDDGSYVASVTGWLMAHEVAHYFWAGNKTWINEGSANLIATVSEEARVGDPVEPDGYPCDQVTHIAALKAFDVSSSAPVFECNYSLGERLFLDLYHTLGDTEFRKGFRKLHLESKVLDDNGRTKRLNINDVREAFRSNAVAVHTVIPRWYDGTAPYDLGSLDTGPPDPDLPSIDGRITDAFVTLDPGRSDGARIDRFSAADVDDRVHLFLRATFPTTDTPKRLSLQYVEFYEDGFAFRRQTVNHVFDPYSTHGESDVSVGQFAEERGWAVGRHWVYVYDGGRKVAEVQYTVTP